MNVQNLWFIIETFFWPSKKKPALMMLVNTTLVRLNIIFSKNQIKNITHNIKYERLVILSFVYTYIHKDQKEEVIEQCCKSRTEKKYIENNDPHILFSPPKKRRTKQKLKLIHFIFDFTFSLENCLRAQNYQRRPTEKAEYLSIRHAIESTKAYN